jgi:hypothetical protein
MEASEQYALFLTSLWWNIFQLFIPPDLKHVCFSRLAASKPITANEGSTTRVALTALEV